MFDFSALREQFPALQRKVNGRSPIYFDGPGGTQTPQRVITAMVDYLSNCNANHGGEFATSRESDSILGRAHQAAADLINAPSADEIIFGANMTTLTFHLSRAVARTLRPGDELIVTRMDHDANVTPWMLAARDAGARTHMVDVHPEDCTLDMDDFSRRLNERTRLVAVACASNAVGTVNDVKSIIRAAHAVGAWVFLDAVHYAPHGLIDVQEWDCDFLACSAYKFFGPHVGILWGKRQHLEELPAYKLRPVPESLPDRWMTGTQNHEGLAGVAAAVDYLADIGRASPSRRDSNSRQTEARRALHAGLTAIRDYERSLARKLLEELGQRPRFKLWGITDLARLHERVPTVSLSTARHSAQEIAAHLAAKEIYVWNGNMYAMNLSERLDLDKQGGFLRIGLVHYNTAEEIDRLMAALDEL